MSVILFNIPLHKFLTKPSQAVCVNTAPEKFRKFLILMTEDAGKPLRGEYWLRIEILRCVWEKDAGNCSEEDARENPYVFDVYMDYDC